MRGVILGAYLERFDMATNLLAVSVGRLVQQVLYDGILVVQLAKGTGDNWLLQRALVSDYKLVEWTTNA